MGSIKTNHNSTGVTSTSGVTLVTLYSNKKIELEIERNVDKTDYSTKIQGYRTIGIIQEVGSLKPYVKQYLI